MNRENDTVYLLIQNMTKGEKRYFQLVNSRSSPKKPGMRILLYNLIDKSTDSYDLIRSKFKNYKVVKNQLYNSIIDTLISYHLKTNSNFYIDRLILKAKILLDKCLYEDCLSFIKKMTPILKEQECFIQLASLFEIKESLLSYYKPYENYFTKDGSHKEEKEILFKKHKNYIEAKSSYKKTVNLLMKIDLDKVEEQSVLKEKLSKKLDFFETNALSKRASRYILSTKVHFHITFQEFSRARDHQLKLNKITLEMYLNGSLGVEFLAYSFINLFTLESKLGLFNFETRLKKFEELASKVKGKHEKDLLTLGKSYFQLIYFLEQKDFFKAFDIYEELRPLANNNLGQFEPRLELNIYYMITFSLFLHEKYSQAQKLILKLIEKFNPQVDNEKYSCCLTINLLIHFEIGEYWLLDGLSRSTKRKLQKLDRFTIEHKVLLNFFSNGLQKNLDTDLSHHFDKLLSRNQIQREIKEENISSDFINSTAHMISYWLSAKANKVSLKTYLEQKTGTKLL